MMKIEYFRCQDIDMHEIKLNGKSVCFGNFDDCYPDHFLDGLTTAFSHTGTKYKVVNEEVDEKHFF
jgi:hypothetical protein